MARLLKSIALGALMATAGAANGGGSRSIARGQVGRSAARQVEATTKAACSTTVALSSPPQGKGLIARGGVAAAVATKELPQAMKLAIGAGGIYAAFMYYGLLQEGVFSYEAADGTGFKQVCNDNDVMLAGHRIQHGGVGGETNDLNLLSKDYFPHVLPTNCRHVHQKVWFLMVLESLANVVVGFAGRQLTGPTQGLPIKLFAVSGATQVIQERWYQLDLHPVRQHSVACMTCTTVSC